MSVHKVQLTLQPSDVLFENHGHEYEQEHDWLKEQVLEQWEDCPLIGEDDYMQVIGYDMIAFEEGMIIMVTEVELED